MGNENHSLKARVLFKMKVLKNVHGLNYRYVKWKNGIWCDRCMSWSENAMLGPGGGKPEPGLSKVCALISDLGFC